MLSVRHVRPFLVAAFAVGLVATTAGVRLPSVGRGPGVCCGGCGCEARGRPHADCCCVAKSKPKRTCCESTAVRVVWVPACSARGCRGDGTPDTTPPKLPEAVLVEAVRVSVSRPDVFARPADAFARHFVRVPPDPPPRAA